MTHYTMRWIRVVLLALLSGAFVHIAMRGVVVRKQASVRTVRHIPRVIWQTHAHDDPRGICGDIFDQTDPSWQRRVLNNTMVDRMVLNATNRRFYDVWVNLKPAVMKYDFWRILVVYLHGGCYLDIDAQPELSWFGQRASLDSIDTNARLYLQREMQNPNYIANFFFCAEPRHAFTGQSIKNMMRHIMQGGCKKDCDREGGVVHATTGPAAIARFVPLKCAKGSNGVYVRHFVSFVKTLSPEKCNATTSVNLIDVACMNALNEHGIVLEQCSATYSLSHWSPRHPTHITRESCAVVINEGCKQAETFKNNRAYWKHQTTNVTIDTVTSHPM